MLDAHPVVWRAGDAGHAVVLGEDGIHKRVVGVEEVKDGAVRAHEVDQEVKRLREHRGAQLICEGGKALAIHGVDFLETAEIEPVAAELRSEVSDAVVSEQTPRLGGDDLGLVQIARGGVREQFRVG